MKIMNQGNKHITTSCDRVLKLKKNSCYDRIARSTCVQPRESGIYYVKISNLKWMRVNMCVSIGIRNLFIWCTMESGIYVLGIS